MNSHTILCPVQHCPLTVWGNFSIIVQKVSPIPHTTYPHFRLFSTQNVSWLPQFCSSGICYGIGCYVSDFFLMISPTISSPSFQIHQHSLAILTCSRFLKSPKCTLNSENTFFSPLVAQTASNASLHCSSICTVNYSLRHL